MRLSSMLSTLRGESGRPLPGRSSVWARLALRQRPGNWLYFPVSAEESRTAAESVRPSLFQLLLAPAPGELPGGVPGTHSFVGGSRCGFLGLHERFLSWALA